MVAMPPRTRIDFGEYLRHRRAGARPPDRPAGGPGAQRRVPGLRRQELAEAAGISVEYYVRLEQGRAPRPSREVLAALARALDLAGAERGHLFRLAGEPPPEPPAPEDLVRPGLLRLLRGLDDTVPVSVHSGRLDLLARNAAATEIFGRENGSGPFRDNIVRHGFTESAPLLLGDEGADRYARWAAAELRAALARYPDDDYLRSLRAELAATSADFRGHWARGEVASARSAVKRLLHPTRGWLEFQSEMLHDPERDHWVVIYASAR